jgi:hypothetical protein
VVAGTVVTAVPAAAYEVMLTVELAYVGAAEEVGATLVVVIMLEVGTT